MKPFRQVQLNSNVRKIFNYRLSRARRIIENVFGVLVARFRIFHTAINLTPKHIDSIVMVCCVVHNFLLKMVLNSYAPPECFDRENTSKGTISMGYEAQNDHTYGLNRSNQSGNPPRTAKRIA